MSALVRRAGIFAGCGEMEKTKTCFEKALAIDSNAADIYIHRARVSLCIPMCSCVQCSAAGLPKSVNESVVVDV